MFVVQFFPNVKYTYILTLAIILQCQKWIITESKCVNPNFRMYRHNGRRPRPFLLCKVLPYFVMKTDRKMKKMVRNASQVWGTKRQERKNKTDCLNEDIPVGISVMVLGGVATCD